LTGTAIFTNAVQPIDLMILTGSSQRSHLFGSCTYRGSSGSVDWYVSRAYTRDHLYAIPDLENFDEDSNVTITRSTVQQ